MQKKILPFLILATFFAFGLFQGISFTTLPAAANFITSREGFAFSPEQYGTIFLPMFLGAIFASLYGGALAQKIGLKAVLLSGQIFNIVAMDLFAASSLTLHSPTTSFSLFLLLMLCLGIGFGAVLTTLNTFAFYFFPYRSKTALTALHSCLGIGAAIGPLLFVFFRSQGDWWQDPLWIGAVDVLLLLLAIFLFPNPRQLIKHSKTRIPFSSPVLWGFVAIGLLYGICETTFGNWGPVFLHYGKGLSPVTSALGLSLFWGMLTLGRIITVGLSFSISPRYIYCVLAPLILLSVILLNITDSERMLLVGFGLAGLGCSAMLPLTIGFAQEHFKSIASVISGATIGVYMLGYGIASQGVGLIYKVFHFSYMSLFAGLSVPICIIFILCLALTRRQKN